MLFKNLHKFQNEIAIIDNGIKKKYKTYRMISKMFVKTLNLRRENYVL